MEDQVSAAVSRPPSQVVLKVCGMLGDKADFYENWFPHG
jgi:hypothetical protein